RTVEAYVTYPADGSTKKAILLCCDAIGHRSVNPQLIADQWAANGYFVVAPDLFHGDAVPLQRSPDFDLQNWLNRHLPPRVEPVVLAVLKEMRTTLGCERVGSAGFCFGAKYSIRLLQPGQFDAAWVAHPSFVDAEEVAAIKGLSLYLCGGGVEHGFASRGDMSDPKAKFAKESAFVQAVNWFHAYL
ncbi:Hydrolase tropI, partial [Penicillium chermesinum]